MNILNSTRQVILIGFYRHCFKVRLTWKIFVNQFITFMFEEVQAKKEVLFIKNNEMIGQSYTIKITTTIDKL
jgi:hypothetical protein